MFATTLPETLDQREQLQHGAGITSIMRIAKTTARLSVSESYEQTVINFIELPLVTFFIYTLLYVLRKENYLLLYIDGLVFPGAVSFRTIFPRALSQDFCRDVTWRFGD